MSKKKLLSDDEFEALDLTADLFDLVAHRIIERGPSADADLREFTSHIHAIQHTIMSQAAARAYPKSLRLLGASLEALRGE